MSVINAHELTMEFLDNVLFSNASFDIEEHDKIGLIGANGSGKTTLFKLIAGEYEPSGGNIFVSSKAKCGYVEQHTCSDFSKTARDELLSVFSNLMQAEKELDALHEQIDKGGNDIDALIEKQFLLNEKYQSSGGLTYRSRAEAMLSGLGFTQNECNLTVDNLSGGQRTKLSLGKLLLSDADLILLDEPTNHLDIKSVEWLEDFLSKYNGTALIVSHDRYFLDKVTTKTMEIENRKIYVRKGNYSVYARLKEEQRQADAKKREQQEKEISRIEGIIKQQKQFNRERNYITIASKEKQIGRIKSEMTELSEEIKPIKLSFTCSEESGNDVLMISDLSKSYGGRILFENIDLNVYKGERIFLLGSNGCGKSTFLKAVLGKIKADNGYCRFGANVKIGYFDQHQEGLASEKTVINEIYDKYPGMTVPEIRSRLGGFRFSGDDIYKRMCDLSGGERARVALLELILKQPNFLILDEPTNHLDIASREVLEDALSAFGGTLLCVSHDRFLVNKLSDKIIILDNGKLKTYNGSYDDYISAIEMPEKKVTKAAEKVNDYKRRKELESLERKKQTRLKRLEAEIEEIEAEKEKTAAELASPEALADYIELLELTEKLNMLSAKQDSLYNEWLELNS